MKIAIIAHVEHPIIQPYAGGLEMHTHLLARCLKRRGHEVTLFASQGSDIALEPVCVCAPTGERGHDRERQEAIHLAEDEIYGSVMRTLADGRFDIVHNLSLHDLPLRESGTTGIPWVTGLHVGPFESFRLGVEEAYDGMAFVAVSKSLAQGWIDIVPQVQIIGNGIDLSAFAFNAVAASPPFGFWSGRIVPEKGLHLAIDAARLAGLFLAFAGPRRDPAYWDDEIEPRLGAGILYVGHLDHAGIARRVGQARVAIVTPCWEEPFGLVVAEALACGTPVAGFRRGAIPEILGADCGRLADADDAEGLAHAIRVAADLDRRTCRAWAEAHFDANTMAVHYETLYARLLEGL